MCLKVHASPTYRKSLLAAPKPLRPLLLPAARKGAASRASHGHSDTHRVHSPRRAWSDGSHSPALNPGVARPPVVGNEGWSCRAGARSPGPGGAHTLVERGARARRAGQGKAGPGGALLTFPADHRSAVAAAGRSAPCQPASGRASARPAPPEPARSRPPAAGTASGSAPTPPFCPAARPLRARPAAGTLGLSPGSRARLGLSPPCPLRRARPPARFPPPSVGGTEAPRSEPAPGRCRPGCAGSFSGPRRLLLRAGSAAGRERKVRKGGGRRRNPAGCVCRSSALLTEIDSNRSN